MALFGKLFSKLKSVATGGASLSVADWEEVERSLIESDLGSTLTTKVIEAAKKNRGDIAESVLQTLKDSLSTSDRALKKVEGRPTTVLVVGVNGTGKTTSTAKLINYLKNEGQSVLVAAADTFRAAAQDQIQTWGQRLGVEVIVGKANGDPASVAFDGITAAKSANTNYFIVDTAGRLHTKQGLMDELEKVRRVIEKSSPVDEVILVMDATTGQNGIQQAKVFIEAVEVTGIILTKMDGSARGGIALAIESETGIPVKFVGTGEKVEDFYIFDPDTYLTGLIAVDN